MHFFIILGPGGQPPLPPEEPPQEQPQEDEPKPAEVEAMALPEVTPRPDYYAVLFKLYYISFLVNYKKKYKKNYILF